MGGWVGGGCEHGLLTRVTGFDEHLSRGGPEDSSGFINEDAKIVQEGLARGGKTLHLQSPQP